MTTTAHNVRARNLQVGDTVELLSLPHVVTAVTVHQDETVTMYTEHTDELGKIAAETPLRADEWLTVFITS